jgi:hypothetical protein
MEPSRLSYRSELLSSALGAEISSDERRRESSDSPFAGSRAETQNDEGDQRNESTA